MFSRWWLLGNLITKKPINQTKLIVSKQFLSSSSSRKGERKRFYKQVSVCESSLTPKSYEINLDKRKLKTPAGKVLQVDNEMLAQLISHEWQSQQDTIKQYTMHLTSLTNTCLDNPSKLTKQSLVSNLNDYLQTDTLIYFDSNSIQKLDNLQETKWRPLVDWFNQKFPDLNLTIKKDIDDSLSFNFGQNESFNLELNSFVKYLNKNFDLNTLIAFNYITECFKSVILTVALLERKIESFDEACNLALLEQKHQYDQWGKVEWYHDVNETELRSRVSAGLLFIYLSNSSKYLVKRNLKVANENQ